MSETEPLRQVIDRACLALGLEFDGVVFGHVAERARAAHPGPESETWASRLTMIARAFGLRAESVAIRLDELGTLAGSDHPMITWVASSASNDAEGDWIQVARVHRDRVEIVDGKGGAARLSLRELARRLNVDSPKGEAPFVVLGPLAPCEGMHHSRFAEGEGGHGADDHGGHGGPTPWQRLIGMMRPERAEIRAIIAFSVATGLLSLAAPLAIEALVSTVAMNMLAQQLLVITLVLFACLALAAALRALHTYVVEMIQRRVFARVAADLAYRLPRVRAEAFDAEHGPERVNRFFDVLTVQKVGGLLLLDGITVVLQAAFGLLILAFYHPYMLTFDVVLLIVLTFIVFQLGRGAIRTSIRESRAKYAVAGALQEMARADVAFKTGRAPEFAIERADRLTRSYLLARRDHFHILMRQIIFALGTQAVATAALLGLGGWLVIERQLTLGQLVAAELVVATVVGSFTKLGKHLEGWYDLMAAVEKLGHLVDLPLERHGGEAPLFDGAGIAIALRDVSYSYDEHHDALQGLSLEIAAGEHVAIVGPSGSGRSTLAQLLYGLRAPSRGSVTYDGLNLSDLDLEAVRDHVALVHDIDVVEDSILDNVRMGRHGVTLRAVYQALEAVRLSEEVARLPHGLHTRLSASGSPLSRGQARRLMLARALAGKPKVVILDEALDGLELDARGAVLDSFFAAQAGFTLVVITSSPEVAARCGRTIAVVRDGDGKSQALENGRAARLDLWMNEVKA